MMGFCGRLLVTLCFGLGEGWGLGDGQEGGFGSVVLLWFSLLFERRVCLFLSSWRRSVPLPDVEDMELCGLEFPFSCSNLTLELELELHSLFDLCFPTSCSC